MDNKKIGNFIKKMRLEQNLSQEDLAQEIPIGRSAISKWETGKTIPDSSTLVILGNIFNVSINELLSGEKSINTNSNNVSLQLYDERNKFKKWCNIILKILLGLIICFLSYFFLTFYKSVKVYDISTSSDKINVDGLLIKTRDKIELKINAEFDQEFKSISLFYKDNDEKQNILTSDDHNLTIKDYLGYEEYIDFKKFNTIVNNMYLKIFYNNNNTEEYKLNLELSYKNKELTLEKNDEVTHSNNNETEESKGYFDIETIKAKICNDNNCNQKVKINNKEYSVGILEDSKSIEIKYLKNNNAILLRYTYLNENIFMYTQKKDDIIEKDYSYNLDTEKCLQGDCNELKEHYKLFEKVIKKLNK